MESIPLKPKQLKPKQSKPVPLRSIPILTLFAAVAALLPTKAVDAQTFPFTLRQGGAAFSIGGVSPRRAGLGPGQLIGVKKQPANLVDPLYTSIDLGPSKHQTTYNIILEEIPGKEPRLFVDANHNGDLTDDPPVVWRKSQYFAFNGKPLTRFEGRIKVQVPYGKHSIPLQLVFLRLDPRDPNIGETQDVLLYTADYVREGKLKLGRDTYNCALLNAVSNGDFRGNFSSQVSGTLLLIDVNHNGVIDGRGEIYEVNKPFNIKGVTYELHIPNADGSVVTVVKSKKAVAEIPPPPDLRVGKAAPSFQHKTLDGKTIRFPTDYRGKLVLLYFWADWCPDCFKEIPNVRQAYETFHARGLEILGLSIEPDDQQKKLANFLEENKMPWPQTYDGNLWLGKMAQTYFVLTTPTGFLVDADTGKILATRNDLLGPALSKTIEKALAARKH